MKLQKGQDLKQGEWGVGVSAPWGKTSGVTRGERGRAAGLAGAR